MEQCTFKPQIISKLSKLEQGKTSRVREVTNRLSRKNLNSAKERQAEPEIRQPKINQISNIIVKKNFYERLEEDTSKR